MADRRSATGQVWISTGVVRMKASDSIIWHGRERAGLQDRALRVRYAISCYRGCERISSDRQTEG